MLEYKIYFCSTTRISGGPLLMQLGGLDLLTIREASTICNYHLGWP